MIPLNESDPWSRPTSCCIAEFNEYKPERDLLKQDKEQAEKVNEAITHVECMI